MAAVAHEPALSPLGHNMRASGKRYLRQATTDESLYGSPDFQWRGFDTMLGVKNMSLYAQKRVRGTLLTTPFPQSGTAQGGETFSAYDFS